MSSAMSQPWNAVRLFDACCWVLRARCSEASTGAFILTRLLDARTSLHIGETLLTVPLRKYLLRRTEVAFST